MWCVRYTDKTGREFWYTGSRHFWSPIRSEATEFDTLEEAEDIQPVPDPEIGDVCAEAVEA